MAKELRKVLKVFPLVTQLGFQFIFTVLISVWIGIKLDNFWGRNSGLFAMLGIIVGILAAIVGAYQLLVKFFVEENVNDK